MEHKLMMLIIVLGLIMMMLKMMFLLWWKPRKLEQHFSKQGIKGPPYHFFIGNVKEIVGLMIVESSSQPFNNFSHNNLPRVLPFYHHWKKIYGATFLVWFGSTGRLTITDPDLLREIFASKSELYEKNEAHPLMKQLEGDGLLSLKGEKWAHHRKIITPTFHMENLKMLMPVMAKSVTTMLDQWSTSDSGEVEVEVSEMFQSLTEEVVTRTVFGINYEDGKLIFQLQTQLISLCAQAFNNVFIPGYRFLPTKRNMDFWKLNKAIKTSLDKLINLRKMKLKIETSDENCPRDLLGLMIEANMKSSSKVTYSDIIEECKTFFFAGKQTSSNLLTWTTVLLAMHPQWQHLAREEVLSVCGSRDIPTKDDVVKLKTMSMIINESLRLYPPTVATIRRAKVDLELGTLHIPRGTEILIPILAVHHDPVTWGKDVNEFNPARFTDGVTRAAEHPFSFLPFGLGLRTCIGQNLAILQTKLTVAIILQRFSFKLSPTYRHAPTVSMMLHPQFGAPIVFRYFYNSTDSTNQGS